MSRFDILKSLLQVEPWKVVSGVVVVGIATAVWLKWKKNQTRNMDGPNARRTSKEDLKDESSSEATTEEHKMVNLEIDPEFIEPVSEDTPLHIKTASRIPKPILHNKDEKSPVIADENVEEIGHFLPTPRDDVEMKHMHERLEKMDSEDKDKPKKLVVIPDSEEPSTKRKHIQIQDERTNDETRSVQFNPSSSKSDKPMKSILHNKDEKSPIVANENVEILVHKGHVPQDELEKKHAHDVKSRWATETCSNDNDDKEEDEEIEKDIVDDKEASDEDESAGETPRDQHHASVHWNVQSETTEQSKHDVLTGLPTDLKPQKPILHNKSERSPVLSEEYVEELVHELPTPRDELEQKHFHDRSGNNNYQNGDQ